MTDRRICPTCCHFRDADVPCSDAFHIAPPSETKLSEAIAQFEVAVANNQNLPQLESLNAARSSLESLFEEQRAEYEQIDTNASKQILGLIRERDDWRAIAETNFKDFQSANDELSALRSLQLTQAEANLLLGAMKHAGYDGPLSEPTREKLQRISSKATSEEL